VSTPARPVDTAETYTLQVAGHLDDHWADWLGGVAVTRNPDATTTLTVGVADQAQLHGVLVGIRDIGASLLGLRRADQTAPALQRTLTTERLTLRSADPQDADATWRYRRLASVNQWLSGTPESLATYRDQFVEPARLAATVLVERGELVIGDFMLRIEDAWSQADVAERARGAQAELGWVLDPAHTGAGYATEAVHELLRHSFEDLGVHRVVATCFLDNDASWRLMERVGMRRETHAVAESLHRSGGWLDTVTYALLDAEWIRDRA
jgi:RimJ/RimL family protein N-acetyltransferase